MEVLIMAKDSKKSKGKKKGDNQDSQCPNNEAK